jgi:hypothetical protein
MDVPAKNNAKWNPRINGTPRGHAYLRKHRLKRKNMAPETVPIVAFLLDNADTFAKTLEPIREVLQSGKVIAWDTEYDQYGNRCEVKHIREWRFKKLDTGVSSNLLILLGSSFNQTLYRRSSLESSCG